MEKNKQIFEKASMLNEEALLTFLVQTKEGRYAKVDDISLPYLRLKEQREEFYYVDEYYYSLR